MIIDPAHNGCSLALLRELYVALHLLNDLHHVNLLGGDDVADIGVDDCIFLEDLLALEVD